MTHRNNIAFNIKQRREELGYSQEYMANALDISQSGYAKIENGQSDISVSRLIEIAKTLDCHVNQLMLVDDAGRAHVFEKDMNKTINLRQFALSLGSSEIAFENIVHHLLKEIKFLRGLLEKQASENKKNDS